MTDIRVIPCAVGDRVLVKQMKKKISETGVIIAPAEVEDALKLPKGEVYGVGTGDDVRSLGLEIGDIVYFNAFSGTNVKFGKEGEEEEFLILAPHEILLKEEEDSIRDDF